jgi:malate dehydrogenase (oxaloacetate-decarboxylating)
MCFAAADALADHVGDALDAEHLLPTMDDWEVFPREAAAVGMMAQQEGLARVDRTAEELQMNAQRMIKRSRDLTQTMMEQDFIQQPPS